MNKTIIKPDYVFETSWEVCNKVGGIYTAISTKAPDMADELGDNFIMIGPDMWKGNGATPGFSEDRNLMPEWRIHAEAAGFRIKIGRWQIKGEPIVILIDFKPFSMEKDDILGHLWARYKLDSITGGWDYIEPVIFGYAVGKVIENFYDFHVNAGDKVIAQFHEWITGAGLLYLAEHVPQIATVFTTHATVLGRALAESGLPFYSRFDSFDSNTETRNFNVIAKNSLEKIAAANAGCFTTVSAITAKECKRFLGKSPDMLTPDGFDDAIVPASHLYREKRAIARAKLLQVAKALTAQDLPDDALLVLTSGRNEFRNKGTDLFIDALGVLNKSGALLKKQVVAFIFIPANHLGPRRELLEGMKALPKLPDPAAKNEVLTHYMPDPAADPILQYIHKNGLDHPDATVKVVFAPVYLDGHDGVFDLDYYDLLPGFDMSVFPSYYEPWGYTPLESLAFSIPTVTTDLTGFGMLMNRGSVNIGQGLAVVKRNDNDYDECMEYISDIIIEYSGKTDRQIREARHAAAILSRSALWKNLIVNYQKAYALALEKVIKRSPVLSRPRKRLYKALA